MIVALFLVVDDDDDDDDDVCACVLCVCVCARARVWLVARLTSASPKCTGSRCSSADAVLMGDWHNKLFCYVWFCLGFAGSPMQHSVAPSCSSVRRDAYVRVTLPGTVTTHLLAPDRSDEQRNTYENVVRGFLKNG